MFVRKSKLKAYLNSHLVDARHYRQRAVERQDKRHEEYWTGKEVALTQVLERFQLHA